MSDDSWLTLLFLETSMERTDYGIFFSIRQCTGSLQDMKTLPKAIPLEPQWYPPKLHHVFSGCRKTRSNNVALQSRWGSLDLCCQGSPSSVTPIITKAIISCHWTFNGRGEGCRHLSSYYQQKPSYLKVVLLYYSASGSLTATLGALLTHNPSWVLLEKGRRQRRSQNCRAMQPVVILPIQKFHSQLRAIEVNPFFFSWPHFDDDIFFRWSEIFKLHGCHYRMLIGVGWWRVPTWWASQAEGQNKLGQNYSTRIRIWWARLKYLTNCVLLTSLFSLFQFPKEESSIRIAFIWASSM